MGVTGITDIICPSRSQPYGQRGWAAPISPEQGLSSTLELDAGGGGWRGSADPGSAQPKPGQLMVG